GSGTLRVFVIRHAKSKPAIAAKKIAAGSEYRMYAFAADAFLLSPCAASACSDGVMNDAVSVGSEPDSRNFWIARASAAPLGYRSSGSFAMARETIASSSGDTSV